MLRNPHDFRGFPKICPECGGYLYLKPAYKEMQKKCENCGNIERIVKCFTRTCKFHENVCMMCYEPQFQQSNILKDSNDWREKKQFNLIWIALGVSLVLTSMFLYYRSGSRSDGDLFINNSIKKLKVNYPLQRNDTWYHFLGVLEKTPPTVKSIIFLHDADRRTADCLMGELVSLFSENNKIRIEDITFSGVGFEGADYGLVLEHYRRKISSSRVFMADLTEISGNMARIFHSLCDEVSSDIKPSLFVFRLKCDKKMGNLKPLERATAVLQEMWRDLPDNELYPLLSRVVKNVVDIVPETELHC